MFEWFKNLFKREATTAELKLKAIKYTLNDPTTASLVMNLLPPSAPKGMAFTVNGYKGGGYAGNTIEGQAANDFVTLANSIKLIQTYRPRLQNWAATRNLKVVPRAGRDLNAYYNRAALKFFYTNDPALKKIVYTADSSDVVAHELGHGILDALRPDLWNLQTAETWGFHEAYGDINAILSILNYKPVIDYILNETKNDLSKDNVVSRLAEELGTALYDLAGVGTRGVLRNAINNFTYTRPELLPNDAPDNQLSSECHSFGRLFLGAWYEIFVEVYNCEYTKTKNAFNSVVTARDVTGSAVVNAMSLAPATNRFYGAVANAMVSQVRNKPEYSNIFSRVFTARKIPFAKIKVLSDMNIKDLKLRANDEIINFTDRKGVLVKKTEKVVLSKQLSLTAQAVNPLFDLEIEVPGDAYYEFNAQGKLIQEISETKEDVLNSARSCLNYLHSKNQVGGERNMWDIEGQKLVRTKFVD